MAAVVLTQTLLVPSTGSTRAVAATGTAVGAASGIGSPAAQSRRRPGPLRLALIGDSYFNGKGARGGRGMGVVLAERLGADLTNFAEGGTGWADDGPDAPATSSFDEHGDAAIASDPDLVVVGGGFNDHAAIDKKLETYDDVAANARTLLGRLSAARGVRTVVMGPFWIDGDPPESMLRLRNVLRAEAELAGVAFVDPIAEGWIDGDRDARTGNARRYIRGDRIHPSPTGHRYLGRRMARSIDAIVPIP